MKKIQKILALILMSALVLGLAAGCATQEAAPAEPPPEPPVAPPPPPPPPPPPEPEVEPLFTPGTFTGVGTGGFGGDITVAVTFDEMYIIYIEVLEHNETDAFSSMAFGMIIPAILSTQSPNVDTIAGATATSTALLEAVSNAIAQAGADPAAFAEGALDFVFEGSTQADVIVVGGGMGGLVSAISAAENGASVILIEKLAVLGGSTNYGAGLSVAGSRWHLEQEDTGITHDELYAGWVNLQLDDPRQIGFYDASLIRPMVDNSGEAFNWLLDHDYVPFLHAGGRMLQPDRPADWVGWPGVFLVEFLENTALGLGVEIHRNTRGMELVQGAGGRITGVIAQGLGGQIEFTANSAVILATGGFSRDPELMQRFLPQLAAYVPFSHAAIGHMGDGMRMAEAVGAVPYPDPWLIGLGLRNEFAPFVASAVPGILVNSAGERFVMETRPAGFIDHYTYIYNFTITYSPGGAFFVFDSSEVFDPRITQVENNINHPDAFRGETIEELAAAMGVPADTLQAEIDHINAVAAGQTQDRLGRTVGINPITEAPFYAIRMFPMDMGTIGGVIVNEYYQVLDANGNVIPGLLAVGEMSNRRYIAPMYFSGLSLMLTLQQGIVAGQAAAR